MTTVSQQWLATIGTYGNDYMARYDSGPNANFRNDGVAPPPRNTESYVQMQALKYQMELHKKEMEEREKALKAEIEESRAMLRDFMEFAQMGKEPSVLDSLPTPTPWQESMIATSVLEPSSA